MNLRNTAGQAHFQFHYFVFLTSRKSSSLLETAESAEKVIAKLGVKVFSDNKVQGHSPSMPSRRLHFTNSSALLRAAGYRNLFSTKGCA
ncbi:MAG TPA: hypothetical protein VGZ47_22680, partial [Gemmataceae bacterium]|nr:hypothetical protein [Gemmataceae bacterium]